MTAHCAPSPLVLPNSEELLRYGSELLLEPGDLDLDSLDAGLAAAMGPGIDFAELYFQYGTRESWSLEDGVVKSGAFSLDSGVGVRSMAGEKTGFAYASHITPDTLRETGQVASRIVRSGQSLTAQRAEPGAAEARYQRRAPGGESTADAKVALLQRADRIARGADPAIVKVSASLGLVHDVVLVRASDGTLAADSRPMIRFNVSVIALRNGRRESGSSGGGGRFSLAQLEQRGMVESIALEAVRVALVNLDAVAAPAGDMPVVLGAGWPGVLLHEAVGHGLEGDFNRKGSSAFAGRLGEQVAAAGVTVVDDATLTERRGSLSIDDEGTPGQCTTLIENGRLTGYMQDKLNARLMGHSLTGNGRRESYAHLPMPRMTNTYMLGGQHQRDEMIASVSKGLFAVGFSGGQVDITSGKFVFAASEAYLIENGKLGAPVKGATIIGSGPEAMGRISMIGDDLELDNGVGICGKQGQSVPVGVGQPSLKLDSITVGGTQS
ncbi:metalloprotease TldD [Carnimonas bestiolae]|uniref:metalloprotease TldD n=1 Tax=Carnimonas bestiolae TaxID=3402172 RepID=UPI003EDC02B7